ncbi:mCG1027197 [Mus musculus]|nr:mCG1027197 [Mus musculus]
MLGEESHVIELGGFYDICLPVPFLSILRALGVQLVPTADFARMIVFLWKPSLPQTTPYAILRISFHSLLPYSPYHQLLRGSSSHCVAGKCLGVPPRELPVKCALLLREASPLGTRKVLR